MRTQWPSTNEVQMPKTYSKMSNKGRDKVFGRFGNFCITDLAIVSSCIQDLWEQDDYRR